MLKEKLQQDIKEALKSGNSHKRMVLGMVMSAVKNKEIDKKGDLTDEEVIAVISSEVKKRRDSIMQFEKGGRPELAEQEKEEAKILMEYMPEQMSEEQIRAEVKKAISETGATDAKEMGKVMAALAPKIKGKADGQLVSKIVKEELS
jgi:uncharacterized protein YqeY